MKQLSDIESYLSHIEEPNRSRCLKLLTDNAELFCKSPGSGHNHQAWIGGYIDHILETMKAGKAIFEALSAIRLLPFSLSDVILIMFLHDLEKPWKYVGNVEFSDKQQRKRFRADKIKEYLIDLSDEHINALEYVEGENEHYSKSQRMMGQLAAVCHMADIASARLWPEERL